MWSIWPSYQKHLLLSKISRNKKSEKERCTFRGVMDSAHFPSHEKRSYPIFAYTGKHLANYNQKLSIISKQSMLALWRQSDYIANILMITNYILLL